MQHGVNPTQLPQPWLTRRPQRFFIPFASWRSANRKSSRAQDWCLSRARVYQKRSPADVTIELHPNRASTEHTATALTFGVGGAILEGATRGVNEPCSNNRCCGVCSSVQPSRVRCRRRLLQPNSDFGCAAYMHVRHPGSSFPKGNPLRRVRQCVAALGRG